jgi:hypothetical protein
MRTIKFDSVELTFDVAAVPDPPTITFADDVESLFTEWYCSRTLIVAGQGIPVRHWDKFYGKRAKIKPHAWESLRSTWNNWKVSVTVYLKGRPTQLLIGGPQVHCSGI